MEKIGRKERIHSSLLLLLVIFLSISNYIWSYNNIAVAGVDSQNHLLFQLQFFDRFSDIINDFSLGWREKLFAAVSLYRSPVHDVFSWPQFCYLTSSIFLFFNRSLLAARLSLLPYFFILIFATYGIGKKISTKSCGLLAAVIVSFYPMIFESSRQYQLDFPLTAIVALSICALLYTDGFKHTGWTIFSALSLGIGMHIKGQSLFFVMPVLSAIIVKSIFFKDLTPRALIKRKLSNFWLFIILSSAISAIWWADKIFRIPGQFLEHLGHPEHMYYSFAGMESYSLNSILFYSKAFSFNALGLIFFIIFLFLLPFF
jgi:4-amino-4-deoxy-L-arabinose transferase-like glycosyltransferase